MKVIQNMTRILRNRLRSDTANSPRITIEGIEAIRKSERKNWEKTFDAIEDWICIIDKNSNILRSNRTVEKYFSVPVRNAIGMSCCSLLHGTDGPIDACPVTRMLKSLKREFVEMEIGNGRWMMITVDPVFNHKMEIISIVHIARDITDRIRARSEREKLLSDLKKAALEIRTLSGLIPICSVCKKIRDDKGYWTLLEKFIEQHSNAAFSHGMCPECTEKLYGNQEWYIEMKKKHKNLK